MSANLDDVRRRSSCYTYEAATTLGPVGLELTCAEEPVVDDSAALAAVRLAAADDWLQAVDTWLGPVAGALDWHWGRPADANRVRIETTTAALDLPWPLLRRAGVTQALDLRWPEVEAWWLLDRFHLDETEATMLEAGGLVVLSSVGRWLVAGDGVAVPMAQTSAPPTGDWSVQHRLACSLPQALGWAPLEQAKCPMTEAQLRHRDRLRALGELIPWGRGQALRVSSCVPD